MFSWLNQNKIIYVISNLLVLPAIFIPYIDILSNLSFFVTFFSSIRVNSLLSLIILILFIVKNNSNYRFNLLLKHKGVEQSKSDYDCVYLYAWCTLLRYFLIGIAINQMFLIFK